MKKLLVKPSLLWINMREVIRKIPGGEAVTKSEIIAALVEATQLKKKEVVTVLDAQRDLIYKTLKKEGQIKLDGLGVFQLKDRKARTARNPRTGETVQVPARRVVKIRVLKALKDEVLPKK
jgi:DNA-binding protein HU-beta